jgi:hypothetical protein
MMLLAWWLKFLFRGEGEHAVGDLPDNSTEGCQRHLRQNIKYRSMDKINKK